MPDKIKVTYRGALAPLTKCAEEMVEAAIVKDVMRHVKTNYGAAAEKIAKTMVIAVNGHSILHLDMYKTALGKGDVVSFLPICGGG
ncbi:MAG: MoaD/ThiS family protein [Treponema sp.]|jgi:molybdopterin converting factor small subunit|nr:MoaD/ThiS family protein [Treponema sp.]